MSISPETLLQMTRSLQHRGPDEEATWSDSFRKDPGGDIPGVALGFRRLAIIDVASGHQPMSNEDNSIHMVFNGEIYNYRDLRKRLEGSGHQFQSDSDSETIIHLYEDEGLNFVKHLNGMFAIAIWDSRKRQLVIARDRLGKKPLYFAIQSDRMTFGSELKSLMCLPDLERRIDPAAIDAYLTYQYIPHPKTIYKDVFKLPPGHLGVWKNNKVEIKSFWNFEWDREVVRSRPQAVGQLRELLNDSIRLRLRSDVPLGAFLSGGVDSSLIVALAQKQLDRPLRTFSIGFSVSDFDETRYARIVSKHIGTEHQEFQVTPQAVDIIDRLTWHYDEPFADSSAIPTWYLSELTRKEVTVALSGDGGDELFAGYERYKALSMSTWVDRWTPLAPLLGSNFFQRLRPSTNRRSVLRRAQRFGQALNQPMARRYMNWLQIFNEQTRGGLYKPEFVEQLPGVDPFEFFHDAWKKTGQRDLIAKASLADLMTYLPCDLMTKVDIASMGNSLECRQPFLDYRLVEFAAGLPSHFKYRWGKGKRILREAFGELLPSEIWNRKKMGFGVPINKWFREDLKPMLHDTLLAPDAKCLAFFQGEALQQMVQQHTSGSVDHCYRLWSLLMLESWLRRWN